MIRMCSSVTLALLVLMTVAGCRSVDETRSPLVIAHRGGAMEAPENTLASCRHSIEAGFDGVEIDVRVTRDGEAVVIHDGTLARTDAGDDKRPIRDLTSSQLAGADVGSSFDARFAGEPVPTFDQVLALDWSETRLMIEVKREGKHDHAEWREVDQRLVDAVLKSMRRAKDHRGLAFASFSVAILRRLHDAMPEIPLIGIAGEVKTLAAHIELPIEIAAISGKLATRELMVDMRDLGIAVWCWTVRKPEELGPLIALGVDGIITDIPTEVRAMLDDVRLGPAQE